MIVTQVSPATFHTIRRTPSNLGHHSMSTSPHPQRKSTSVFNALGSYADRIKSPPNHAATLTPNGTSPAMPGSALLPPDAGPAKSEQRREEAVGAEDDGAWETVQISRHRPREERRLGGNARNWRDRPVKESNTEDTERRAVESKAGKNSNSSSAPPPPSSARVSTSRPAVTPSAPPKSAWGSPVVQRQLSHPTPSSASSTSMPTSRASNIQQSQTEPSSPSVTGTTATTSTSSASVPASIASPNPSAETASSSTAPTSVALRGNDEEEEESWTLRGQPDVDDLLDTPVPKAAPPPVLNAWTLMQATPTPVVKEELHELKRTPALQFGTVTTAIDTTAAFPDRMPNGDDAVKIAKKKKAVSATAPTPALGALNDTRAWPDVSQAATKAAEEKKEKVKEKKGSEESSVVDDASSSRRPKWTAIPATELLAAADEAAEVKRRETAVRSRAMKNEAAASPNKAKMRKASLEGRNAVRPAAAGSSEIRMPPMPQGQRRGSIGFKPTFGTVSADSESSTSAIVSGTEGRSEVANGGLSAPLSRHTSRQSRRDPSPQRARTQQSSPNGQNIPLEGTSSMRFGSGPLASKPTSGNATAPVPQNSFNPGHIYPRPPRGYGGRGRGYRNSFSTPMANGGNMYQRGYGMGHQQYYPPAPAYTPAGLYDPMQAQYMHTQVYGRGAPPPPPLPQTVIPGLDPVRFYVLGQVEYYFSMQNLAMDFFLRQQMDSEGWIDIAMIGSFNRVKSLIPEPGMVREVMNLSSLLEVRDEKVRLANGESKRWVLPNAKLSTLGADSPVEEAMGAPITLQGETPQKFAGGPGDVESALMKSVPPSSSTSVLNGDDSMEKTDTPGTSMSGDGKEEEEVMAGKVLTR